MDRLIYVAMSGAKSTLGRQDASALNLANAASTGYRAEEHRLRAVEVRSPALPTRAFVIEASVGANFTPGVLQPTGRTLDVALQGAGWIALAPPDGGEAYTRNGSLQLDSTGILQTKAGIPVLGDGGPITIPPGAQITIAGDGTVSSVPAGSSAASVVVLGRIKLVNPPEKDLARGDDGLFRVRGGGSAETDPKAVLVPGHLEAANVNAVEEMVNMISAARQFEIQVQMLRNAEENDRTATQLLSNR
ncbi:MAG TPA: flagellar biosynthesis protein FlgF [Rhodocyclaceae bacterium]|nr:MAG: flagellar biosynthesis protein FlgF [Betaproteobacteria bacterium CG2_30_68_42]PIV76894.1 MAG: flagellar biosynthesis protein FlgF [Rhodocyclales bacterium CG17_big_fil_post_rev_8_21_14_2_50_68_7]PJA56977.1 MAG: flagellar biosynthesis protein FlgF [Rhodocyclales bacterium CG_4_9_14_3_um_filter_68_10]HCX32934.1 flagellar biosynthesis protein FlgF [Rhodocyclaceae bacterium]